VSVGATARLERFSSFLDGGRLEAARAHNGEKDPQVGQFDTVKDGHK
jgi:hypothetical protein